MPEFTVSYSDNASKPALWSNSKSISFEDYLELTTCVFNWADSYDAKGWIYQDWDRLRGIIAPTLLVDYTDIGKPKWDNMTSTDFMAMVTDEDFLGDACVKTQHLLGMTSWERVSETEVIGRHQLRAAHQVYTDASLTEVKLKGHSHATNEHYYKKINGVWKFAGLKPTVRWNEHNFEKVFKGSYVEISGKDLEKSD